MICLVSSNLNFETKTKTHPCLTSPHISLPHWCSTTAPQFSLSRLQLNAWYSIKNSATNPLQKISPIISSSPVVKRLLTSGQTPFCKKNPPQIAYWNSPLKTPSDSRRKTRLQLARASHVNTVASMDLLFNMIVIRNFQYGIT